MIEAGVPDSGAAPEVAAPAGPSAGAMLRSAREAAGVHVAALAVSMKVPVAKLEALEQDRHDLLPDAVFARALALSICRTLKVDPAPILARLPQTGKPRLLQDTDGLNAPFRSPRDAVAPNWKEQLTRPVSLAVGALLLGVAVVLLLPTPAEDGATAVVNALTGEPPAAHSSTGGTAPATAVPPPSIMTASVAVPAAPAVAAVPVPAAPAADTAAPARAPAATASVPAAAAPADGVVVFRASGASWIEVRDAKGAVPVRKLLAAGETAGASGAMPLQVTIGNAGATEVQVRGKPFDLRAITRDNVARFEVK